jgi:hypothetical protein
MPMLRYTKTKKRLQMIRGANPGHNLFLVSVKMAREMTRARFKTVGNPTRERGIVRKRLEYQSLAHASGYQMRRIEGYEMHST